MSLAFEIICSVLALVLGEGTANEMKYSSFLGPPVKIHLLVLNMWDCRIRGSQPLLSLITIYSFGQIETTLYCLQKG